MARKQIEVEETGHPENELLSELFPEAEDLGEREEIVSIAIGRPGPGGKPVWCREKFTPPSGENPIATMADIYEQFGGGCFVIWGRSARGYVVARSEIVLEGKRKPLNVDDEPAEARPIEQAKAAAFSGDPMVQMMMLMMQQQQESTKLVMSMMSQSRSEMADLFKVIMLQNQNGSGQTMDLVKAILATKSGENPVSMIREAFQAGAETVRQAQAQVTRDEDEDEEEEGGGLLDQISQGMEIASKLGPLMGNSAPAGVAGV